MQHGSNTSVVIGGLTHNPAYGPDLGRVEKTLNFNMNMVRVCQIRIKPLHPNERIIVFLPKPKLTPYFHGWDHSIFRASLRLNPKLTQDLDCLYNHYLDFIWSVSWYTEPIQFPIVQGLVPVAGAGGWPCYRCSTLLPSPASLGSLPCPLTLSVAWSSQTSETGDSRLLPISVILQRFT